MQPEPKSTRARADFNVAKFRGFGLRRSACNHGMLYADRPKIFTPPRFCGTVPSMTSKDLRGASFRGADLYDRDFSDADLRGADLYRANANDADFRGADLRGAMMSGAQLRYAAFGDADLSGADLSLADLREASMKGAVLTGADLSGALRADDDAAIRGWVRRDGRLVSAPRKKSVANPAHKRKAPKRR